MKVVFGCPIFNFQDTKIRQNHELVREQSKHDVVYVEVVGASVEHAKQIMYREFLKTDADYFFNVDADIMFLNYSEINPVDALVDLCESLKGIVGGIYVYKRPGTQPTHRPLDLQKEYEKTGRFPENYKFDTLKSQPFEVEWLSGGCMMIKREIIEKLMAKYQIPNLPTIHKKEYLSEDFAFCKRAREEGYPIWAEPAIELGHMGNYLYTFLDYKP